MCFPMMISFLGTLFGFDVSTNGIACKHYEWAYSQLGYPKIYIMEK